MTQIVSVHSYRGGTGKSNLTANLGALLAQRGLRVGIVDTDIQSPGIHVLFGLDDRHITRTLNDYLWGQCSIEEAAYPAAADQLEDRLYLIPSSLKTSAITRILREGYDVERLNDGFREISTALKLDRLLIDTHPGLNSETLMSIAISDVLMLLLRPDQQDYQGTAVTVEVARRLDVPKLFLVVNKMPPRYDAAAVSEQVSSTYQAPVAGVLPHSDAMMELSSSGVFALRYPDDPLTATLSQIASHLL